MLSWKTVSVTLVLSLTGALILQYGKDGPAGHKPPGADRDAAAGPSAQGPEPHIPGGLPESRPSNGMTETTLPEVSTAVDDARLRGTPAVRHPAGTRLTRPYLEDDDDPGRIAAAAEPPEPQPMTASEEALLDALGVDLARTGPPDESADFLDWFPARAEAVFGGGAPTPPPRRDPASLPPDERD